MEPAPEATPEAVTDSPVVTEEVSADAAPPAPEAPAPVVVEEAPAVAQTVAAPAPVQAPFLSLYNSVGTTFAAILLGIGFILGVGAMLVLYFLGVEAVHAAEDRRRYPRNGTFLPDDTEAIRANRPIDTEADARGWLGRQGGE